MRCITGVSNTYDQMRMKGLLYTWVLLSACSTPTIPTHAGEEPPPEHMPYTQFLAEVDHARQDFQKQLDTATSTNREKLIKKARHYLEQTITQGIFPYWYGTPWDFNGHTSIPGEGEIACGYFVTTVLQDAGFNLPRYKWAQQYSQYYIKRLSPQDMTLLSNYTVERVKETLISNGTGLYVVGLDNHTGFVWVKDSSVVFVHSNYYQPQTGVMAQEITSENPLKHSAFRLFGRLFSDDMVENWITHAPYQ